MLRKNTYLILFIILPFTVFPTPNQENTDSLILELNHSSGERRMELLNQISKEYFKTSVEEAVKYATELFQLADESENLKYIGLATSLLGEAYFYMDNLDKSVEFFKKFLETSIQQNDFDAIGKAYNNLGIAFGYIDKFNEAIEYYNKSLNIREEQKDSVGISNIYNNIGVLYFRMGDYNKALDYYKRSLDVESKLNNKSGIATSLLNIGEVHSKINRFDDAVSYFNRSIEIAEAIADYHTLEMNYSCLYEMYKQTENFQKALFYYELFSEIKSKRINDESRSQIAELEVKYETVKNQKEISFLSRRNDLNKTIIVILIIAFLLLLNFAYLFYSQYKSKIKAYNLLSNQSKQIEEQRTKLESLNKTKDKFFSIISHDLKGAIGGFLAQTQFLADDFQFLSDEDKHDLISKMHHTTQNLYSLLENLLEWSKTQTEALPFSPESFSIKQLFDSVLPLFKIQMQEKQIVSNINIDKDIIVYADLNMASAIVRNLILNSIKYSNTKGEIKVAAKIVDNFVEIEVADTGVGMSVNDQQRLFRIDQSFSNPGTQREKGTGLGLILCKEFIENNGGKIWVNSELGKGTTFKFTLPLGNIVK